jgi:ABC-type polysaccharide/polyol phosphate export permease
MLNPLTRLIIAYKDAMVDGRLPTLTSVSIVLGSALAAVLIGSYAFDRLQRRFAEAI